MDLQGKEIRMGRIGLSFEEYAELKVGALGRQNRGEG